MAVIIGGGSNFFCSDLLNDGTGVVSVNFDLQSTATRLWELGSFEPYTTSIQKQRTLSVVVYGSKPDGSGGTKIQTLTPSTTCGDTDTYSIEFPLSNRICPNYRGRFLYYFLFLQ
jgi:hypothetical protein